MIAVTWEQFLAVAGIGMAQLALLIRISVQLARLTVAQGKLQTASDAHESRLDTLERKAA